MKQEKSSKQYANIFITLVIILVPPVIVLALFAKPSSASVDGRLANLAAFTDARLSMNNN